MGHESSACSCCLCRWPAVVPAHRACGRTATHARGCRCNPCLCRSDRTHARFPGFEEALRGTPVQLETDLGLPSRAGTTPGSLTLRIGQRWRVEGWYLELGRSGSAVLSHDVDVGDFRFTAGTVLNLSVSLRTLRVNADGS